MKNATLGLLLVGLVGCGGEGDEAASDDSTLVFQVPKSWSAWSTPVLVEELNTSANDANPCFAPDDLTVYFASNRPGGLGGHDIWFSRRASADEPWGAPENLGAPVNSDADEQGPSISQDGFLLFFISTRAGGFGDIDIYVSRRTDPMDDSAWGTPENVGSDVNTSGAERSPHFQGKGEKGGPTLYFQRGSIPHIYVAPMTKDGATLGPAVEFTVLNSSARDAGTMVRKDGLELFFHSNRTGTLGAFDLYVCTRASTDEPWSDPVNIGAPVNSSAAGEFDCALSFDSQTLLLTRDLGGGGAGAFEIWMSTRTVVGSSGGN